MFLYQLRNAWRSLRRNPVLSLLLVAGIALGIGVSTTFVTVHHLFSSDPLPGRSDDLYYVRIDSWDPSTPWDDDRPELPPDQLSWRDLHGLRGSGIPTAEAGMYKAALTVHPDDPSQRPFRELVRMTDGDFFSMFRVPFRYGGGWDAAADRAAEPVVVLGADLNRRLFGGRDSVGERIRVEDRLFQVVGVLDRWRPTVKFYDVHNGPFDPPEELFMPLSLAAELEARTAGNNSGWRHEPVYEEFAEFLALSDDLWTQYWVQLEGSEERSAYRDHVDAYVLAQKEAGRMPRPLNNLLQPMGSWLEENEVVPEESRGLLVISLLFLLVCAVNLIGILLAKFLGRAPEVGVRRALGASRRQVFAQHLVECELIALLGGVAGLGLSLLGLRLLERLFELAFAFDPAMVAAAVVLALAAGLVAGLYPAWRICRVPPADYLKA